MTHVRWVCVCVGYVQAENILGKWENEPNPQINYIKIACSSEK